MRANSDIVNSVIFEGRRNLAELSGLDIQQMSVQIKAAHRHEKHVSRVARCCVCLNRLCHGLPLTGAAVVGWERCGERCGRCEIAIRRRFRNGHLQNRPNDISLRRSCERLRQQITQRTIRHNVDIAGSRTRRDRIRRRKKLRWEGHIFLCIICRRGRAQQRSDVGHCGEMASSKKSVQLDATWMHAELAIRRGIHAQQIL